MTIGRNQGNLTNGGIDMHQSDKEYRQSIQHLSETVGQSIAEIARSYSPLHGNLEECPVSVAGWSATTISKESRGQVPSKHPTTLVMMEMKMRKSFGNYKRGGQYYFIGEGTILEDIIFYQWKAHELIPVVMNVKQEDVDSVKMYTSLLYVPKEDVIVYRTMDMMHTAYQELMI